MRVKGLAALLLFAACVPGGEDRLAPRVPGKPGLPRSRFHRFHVETTAVAPMIRHDLSLREIARLPGAYGSGLKTQGLTTIKHSMATHTRFSTAKGDAAVYAWFNDVILEVSIASTVIYIPKEYAPSSCEYQAVLVHERQHGRTARVQAEALAGKLEGALAIAEGLPTRFEPVVAADFAAAAETLKAAVAKVVDPVYEQYEKDEIVAQANLDRPDPYDAVYQKCAGWK